MKTTHPKIVLFFLLLLYNSVLYANMIGIAETMYSGTQNIICSPHFNNTFRLYENRNTTPGNSVNITTRSNDD